MEMRTRILGKLINSEVQDYLKRNDIIIVPVGTTEMHGGLPLDCETVLSEALALRMAQSCDGLVLTGLPYFYAGATASGRGTVQVSIRQGIDATLFEKRPKTLILDLSAVGFMDSSGLGLIMGRYSVMKELGGEMTVWNPSPETRAILTLAGMERLVKIAYPQGEERTANGESSGHVQPSRTAPPRKPTDGRVTASSPTARTSPRNPRNPRKRGKNGLVYETDPRKEKNA